MSNSITVPVTLPLDLAALLWLYQPTGAGTPLQALQVALPVYLEQIATRILDQDKPARAELSLAECNMIACERSYEDGHPGPRSVVRLHLPAKPSPGVAPLDETDLI